ncbi:hypothetical protein EJD97_004916 [Solanum chilense]|uniref:Uncharacterized protein n=1 Tax=Solanum chilense TaxID=4083 RepID=A0A6N2CAK0_SOLCI|nr:hypothetical protein EJD97_004916 [Solanum chilense]
MNTKRNTDRSVGEAVAGRNQAPPQSSAAGVQVSFNPAALTDGEVREAMVQMAQAITAKAHTITTQATREGSPIENPHARTVASRPRDLTRINPPVNFGSRTNKDP